MAQPQVILGLTVALAACNCGPYQAPSPPREGDLSDLALLVQVRCESGSWTGSAALVKDGLAISAAHLLGKPGETCTYLLDGHWASPVVVEPELDLVLFKTFAPGRLVTRADEVWLGMRVYHVGYPKVRASRTTRLSVTEGVLATDLRPIYRVTAPLNFGSSGGPVVDRWGRLVCVAVAVMAEPLTGVLHPGEGYCVDAEKVWWMVESYSP